MVSYQPGDLPPGYYAVPDPDDPPRITTWQCRTGCVRRWPHGDPWHPAPRGIDAAERRQWYDTEYRRWIGLVCDAIRANPDAAAARFRELHPEDQPSLAPARRRSPRADPMAHLAAEQRRREEVTAWGLRVAGWSLDRIAEHLGCSVPTAHRRVAAGRDLVAAAELLVHLADTEGTDAFLAAAARFEADDSVTPGGPG